MRYLLIEDGPDVARAIAQHFAGRGHSVDHAPTLDSARDFLAVQAYDAMILDLNLPDGNGMGLLREVRRAAQSVPVLILSVNHGIETRLEGFDAGADDYLFKPFDMRELEARLRGLVQRQSDDRGRVARIGRVEIDFAGRQIRHEGQNLALSAKDFALVEVLVLNMNRPVAKAVLQDKLYGFASGEVSPNAIELRIARIRKKLEGTGVTIRALWGIGYQIEPEG